jgi:subtilase family protein
VNIRRSTVRSETDYTYTDKASGRQQSFTPKPDEAMITFQERTSEDSLNEVLQATPLLSVSQGFNLDRGFAAVYVNPDQGMDAAAHLVQERSETANSLPVMVDQNGLERYFLPDEFTVQFREEISKERAEEIIRERGSRILVEQRTPGYYTLGVPEGRGLFETIREFSDLEEVAFAEPSEAGFNDALLPYIPDDPDFSRLWGLRNTGQTVNGTTGTNDADIDAPEAWDLVRGHADVIVAVIDTGADLNHSDLQVNILPRGTEDWDFADPNDPSPDDSDSHGTHVAGTVAAVDNTVGVIGVAPACRIMPLRVDLTAGMNQNRADAINYVGQQATANPNRRYVINCSWRMNGDHTGVRTAIQNAVNRNVVVVFAAGNDNRNTDTTPQFPGVYPEVIAVAALDQQDRKATFSNFGSNVDVSAPGVNIWSTVPVNSFGFKNGTSMASPHVAGLAALVWSRNRSLTNQQVRQVIQDTCDNIDAANPGFIGQLARGRINAYPGYLPSVLGWVGQPGWPAARQSCGGPECRRAVRGFPPRDGQSPLHQVADKPQQRLVVRLEFLGWHPQWRPGSGPQRRRTTGGLRAG